MAKIQANECICKFMSESVILMRYVGFAIRQVGVLTFHVTMAKSYFSWAKRPFLISGTNILVIYNICFQCIWLIISTVTLKHDSTTFCSFLYVTALLNKLSHIYPFHISKRIRKFVAVKQYK